MRPSVIRQIAAICVCVLLLAACGGGDSATELPAAATANFTATPAVPAPQEATATAAPDEANTTAAPQPSSAAATPVALDPATGLPLGTAGMPLAARVNGVEITLAQLDRAVERRQLQAAVPDITALRAEELDILIQQEIVRQGAAGLGITVSDAAVDAEVQEYYSILGSDQAWQDWLIQNGYTEPEFREALRLDLITQRLIETVVDLDQPVLHVHARHILVYTAEEAAAVVARLDNGEDFAAVAQAVSQDITTAQNGGDLGWFTREQLLEPIVAEVAFSLEPGEYTGPVITRLGYHIIQTLAFEERPLTPTSPEEQAQFTQIVFEQWLADQLDAAVIERYL